MSMNVSPAYLPESQSSMPTRHCDASGRDTEHGRIPRAPAAEGGGLKFISTRVTNEALRTWMTGKISEIYLHACQLAYDVAKRPERAYSFELGLADSNIIQFGYWDSLKKGLVSGAQLDLDLERTAVSYLDLYRPEHELFYQPCLIGILGAVGTRVHATSSHAPGIGTVACRRSPSV
jgi:hypothetical protein